MDFEKKIIARHSGYMDHDNTKSERSDNTQKLDTDIGRPVPDKKKEYCVIVR